jgi:serine/threonine protein kinase
LCRDYKNILIQKKKNSYAAIDVGSGVSVAIKVEPWSNKRTVLKLEVAVVRKLQCCLTVPRFVHCGHSEGYNFLVMELLGENLSELRRKQPGQKFSIGTSLRLAVMMVRSLQEIHAADFIHRDVKPSNFVLGVGPNKDRLYTIDFGLARRFMGGGAVRPARQSAGFRGTARYASINSHVGRELSRRDDLWSLVYVLVEMMVGQLPWRRIKDKDEILTHKTKFMGDALVANLPAEIGLFQKHVMGLQYEDAPDYELLCGLLTSLYKKEGLSDDTPFDWNVAHEPAHAADGAGGTGGAGNGDDAAAGAERQQQRSGEDPGAGDESGTGSKNETKEVSVMPTGVAGSRVSTVQVPANVGRVTDAEDVNPDPAKARASSSASAPPRDLQPASGRASAQLVTQESIALSFQENAAGAGAGAAGAGAGNEQQQQEQKERQQPPPQNDHEKAQCQCSIL